MQFPSKMYVDYIRVYQRSDVSDGVGCNPSSRPTTDYINKYVILFVCFFVCIDTPWF